MSSALALAECGQRNHFQLGGFEGGKDMLQFGLPEAWICGLTRAAFWGRIMQQNNITRPECPEDAPSNSPHPAITHISGPATEINAFKSNQVQGFGIGRHIHSHRWPKKHRFHPMPRQRALGKSHFPGQPRGAAKHDAGLMTVGVITQLMAFPEDGADQLRVAPHPLASDKEGGAKTILPQQGQKRRRGYWVWAIIKAKANLPVLPGAMADDWVEKAPAWKHRSKQAGCNKEDKRRYCTKRPKKKERAGSCQGKQATLLGP